MNAQEALAYINQHKWTRSKPGLGRTRQLLSLLGNPQKRLRFVHVAGTNGKGSTCAMLASVMQAAGYRAGLYPSPYLENFRERIQVSGEMIPEADLLRITERVAAACGEMDEHPTQFEMITAIGMLYFAEQRCDIVLLETGMGGELDSTNVIDPPEAAVLTHIGLDHTEYLGHTIPEITGTKCGIIKPGSRAVSYDNSEEAMQVIREVCAERDVPLYMASDIMLEPVFHDLSGQAFRTGGKEYTISLLGAHQLENVRTVLAAVEALRDRGWQIPEEAVRNGLAAARWPGRFEVLRRDPLFILDGGHNPQCAEAVAAGIADYLPGQKGTFLIGMLADKDYREALRMLYPYAERFICTAPDSPRALSAADLAAHIASDGYAAEAYGSTEAALRRSSAFSPVIAFGSFYLAGKVRSLVRQEASKS